jgi:hypothetical protein
MLVVSPDFRAFFPFVTLADVSPGLSVEYVGEAGVASREKTGVLNSPSTEGAFELSRVTELSLSFEYLFATGGGIPVIFFSGEPGNKRGGHETMSDTVMDVTRR